MNNRRNLSLVLTAAALAVTTEPTVAQSAHHDADAIRSVVMSAYIDGLQKNGSRDDIRAGFHPGFVMKVYNEGETTDVTIEDWIARLPAEGQAPDHDVTAEIPNVSVSGLAAVAQVNVNFDGEHVYTDYMSLYRFPEGWRIVAKIFNTEK